jgi:Zn-dependent protease with chaperone function
MSRYAQFLLVIAYGFLTIIALLLVWQLFDLGPRPSNDWVVISIIIGWLAICFSAVYWLTDILLFFMHVRKPILEEEQRLIVCLNEIQKRAKDKKRYRFRITEDMGINAFAIGHHTITVSKGCLQQFTDNELCALLAHEMGHLRTNDCMAAMAFVVANYLPGLVARIFTWGVKFFVLWGTMVILIGIILLFLIFSKVSIFISVVAILGFLLLLRLLNPVFRFLWLFNSRLTEYRQDAFAHELGFGMELKQVLLKILESRPPQPVNQYFIITRSTHPEVHNRIRRLEKLQGLRR